MVLRRSCSGHAQNVPPFEGESRYRGATAGPPQDHRRTIGIINQDHTEPRQDHFRTTWNHKDYRLGPYGTPVGPLWDHVGPLSFSSGTTRNPAGASLGPRGTIQIIVGPSNPPLGFIILIPWGEGKRWSRSPRERGASSNIVVRFSFKEGHPLRVATARQPQDQYRTTPRQPSTITMALIRNLHKKHHGRR